MDRAWCVHDTILDFGTSGAGLASTSRHLEDGASATVGAGTARSGTARPRSEFGEFAISGAELGVTDLVLLDSRAKGATVGRVLVDTPGALAGATVARVGAITPFFPSGNQAVNGTGVHSAHLTFFKGRASLTTEGVLNSDTAAAGHVADTTRASAAGPREPLSNYAVDGTGVDVASLPGRRFGRTEA